VTEKLIPGKFVCPDGRGCRKEKEEETPICNNANCGRKLSSTNRAKVRDPVTHEFIPGTFVCRDGQGCRKRREEKEEEKLICNNANCERKLSSTNRSKVRDPVTDEFIPGTFVCRDGRGCRKEKEEAHPICNNANCERKLPSTNRSKVRDPVTDEFIPGKFVCRDGQGCRKRKR
jgi:DNA recombination-dependent growth factor C